MKTITILCMFIHVILLSNLLSFARPQPIAPNGCVASGLTNCCTLDTCVTQQGCYCDQGCYHSSDCCEDIHLTCPPLDESSLSGGSGESPMSESGHTRPPKITLVPEENVTVPTAHPHRLTMVISYDRGFPMGTLIWRKDGEIITTRNNHRLTVMSNGGISMRNVKPSDRGLYTVTVTNTEGSDSASFKLFTKFANIVESGFKEGSFYCKANGYPTANFIGWTAMNGSSITNQEWSSSHSETSEYESAVTTSLPLHAVNCTDGGVACVFDNGNNEYQVQSPIIDCPTIIEIGFEETEYMISEQAANNQYVALKVCLKETDVEQSAFDVEQFTVSVATQGGTAISGVDFIPISTNRTFSLPLRKFGVCECLSIIQDDIAEGDEVFYLTLTSPHPLIGTTGAAVHIVDDDAVTATLEKAEYFVSESDGCAEVCVLLVGRFQRSVTVYLCVEGITATADEDYVGHNSALPLTFQTSTLVSPETRGRMCASVKLINDNITESDETFRVKLQENSDDPSVILGDQTSAIVTIIDDDRRPLTAKLINNTPRIDGRTVTINFVLEGGSTVQLASLQCKIIGPGRTPPLITEHCVSGVIVEELPPRKQEYIFTLEDTAGGADGEPVVLLKRDFRLDSDVCWLHLVNEGVTINGSSAMFQWQPSGPFPNYKSSSFQCMKDFIREKENCSSPYTWSNLSSGEHRLIIVPYLTPGCRRLLTRTIDFIIDSN